MAEEQSIILRLWQRVKAFLTSRDAVTFCFFVLLSSFVWFIHNKYQTAEAAHETVRTETFKSVQFIETDIYVPLRPTDVPSGKNLTLFQQEVKVHIKLQETEYDAVTPDNFRATCSFPTSEKSALPVSVTCNKPFVEILSIQPLEVDYLID